MTDSDFLEPTVDPKVKKIGIRQVTARNEGGTRTVIRVRDFTVVTDEASGTNTGPTPLETVLASLTGCEAVIIDRVAEAMKFKYSAVDLEFEAGDSRRPPHRNPPPWNLVCRYLSTIDSDLIAISAAGLKTLDSFPREPKPHRRGAEIAE